MSEFQNHSNYSNLGFPTVEQWWELSPHNQKVWVQVSAEPFSVCFLRVLLVCSCHTSSQSKNMHARLIGDSKLLLHVRVGVSVCPLTGCLPSDLVSWDCLHHPATLYIKQNTRCMDEKNKVRKWSGESVSRPQILLSSPLWQHNGLERPLLAVIAHYPLHLLDYMKQKASFSTTCVH